MKIETNVKQCENFLVQMNGAYNVPFDEVKVTGSFPEGTILETASKAVSSSTSSEVLGIITKDVEGATDEPVRVMTRGNPSTVAGSKLVYGDAVEADINALLNAKGIVVVDE